MPPESLITTQRLEAFSDAVFAIILTLLVIDLKVPELGEQISTQQTLTSLIHMGPQFIGFIVSFFIICIFWVNHHQFFHVVKRPDSKLLWLNNLLLFWLCFIPFPTAFLGHYPTNTIATMLFGFVLFAASASFSLMIHYAMFEGDLVEKKITTTEKHRIQNMSYIGVVLYAISILLALISVWLAFFIFLGVLLFYFAPVNIRSNKEAR